MKPVLLWLIVFFLLSCDNTDTMEKESYPGCLQTMIKSANSPLEIWSYLYNKEIVFLAIADCCDQYDVVYSSNCTVVCSPSGGFSGQGDGKCPDFFNKATKGTLVWKKE
ncbi:MAG: hypothetical protein RI909_859 [Bacteroidota bacterium]|jgi:hypothetical protein